MGKVKPRSPFVPIGVLGMAVLAVGVLAVWTAVRHAQAVRSIAVRSTITVDSSTHETFAPPPASAMPAITAAQAFAQWERDIGSHANTTIPSNMNVRLGLLTLPVGPYCGAECHGLIVQHGIAYTVLNQLAYGYSWPAFPHRHTGRLDWTFLDASTGQMIAGVLAKGPAGVSGRRPPSSASPHGEAFVIGYALPCAGPPQAALQPVTVYAVHDGKVIAKEVTRYKGRHDRYRFTLAPGRYTIRAAHAADHAPDLVLLRRGQTVTVNFPDPCS